jgi:threonine dehydrogenase-like Zn-dependent dehydrogenase
LYLVWLVGVGYLAGQQLDDRDVVRWGPPVLLPSAAVVFCVATGWAWWTSVVAQEKSPLRELRIVATLVFTAVASVFCGVVSVDDPSVSIGLLSLVVTGLGMIGLFFIPAASSRQRPHVIRRRAAARRTGPAGPGGA